MRFEETKSEESAQVSEIVGLAREAHPSNRPVAPENCPGASEWAVANLSKPQASPERSGVLRLDLGNAAEWHSERFYRR
jgi:hypothetical protein